MQYATGFGLLLFLSIALIFKDVDHAHVKHTQKTGGPTSFTAMSLIQMDHHRIKANKGTERHRVNTSIASHQARFKPYDHKKLLKTCAVKTQFEKARTLFQKKYSPTGRSLVLPREKLSLDFELETGTRMVLTPELLLIRGGFNVGANPFPNASKWFEVGIDGMGRRVHTKTQKYGGYRQQILSTMELESVPMKVSEVQGSSFLDDLQNFLMAMGHDHKKKVAVPGSTHMHFLKGRDQNAPCFGCHLQWTVGLPLAWVPALLAKSGSNNLHHVMKRLDNLEHCQQNTASCPPEYKGMVSLAAHVLQAGKHCQIGCHPKRCMDPWLVRTHFGDLAKFIRHKLGEDALDRFPADVLEVADVKADTPVFPRGIMDYLHFSELAEIGGLVVPRSTDLGTSLHPRATKCMPADRDGLHLLAKQMLKQKRQVDIHLRSRRCGVYGANESLSSFSAQTWLQQILQGRDIMADSDSPITHESFSKLVWKSMGSWRMTPESGDRIFLECRNPKYCLGNATKVNGPVPRIRNVAEAMQAFEEEMAGTM